MKEIGFGCVALGIALLVFPLYDHLATFIALRPDHAQIAGCVLLMAGAVSVMLRPR